VNTYLALGLALLHLSLGFAAAMLLVSFDRDSGLTMDRLHPPAAKAAIGIVGLSIVFLVIGFMQSQ
jgi:hypothetical protein